MQKLEQLLDIKKNRIFVLIAILLIGLGLRMYNLETRGLWVDEKISITHAVGGARAHDSYKDSHNTNKSYHPNDFWVNNDLESVKWSVVNKSGGNALLYAYSLHYWISIFGISDFSIRFMSVIFSLLGVLVIYKIAKSLWKNHSFAIISAFLLSTSYLSVQYAHEARTYSLSIFLTLVSTLLLIKFIQTDELKKKIILIALYLTTILLSFFGHFLIISVLLGHGVLFLILGGKKIPNYIYLTICYSLFIAIVFYYVKETDCLNKLNANGDKWTIAAQDPANNIDTSLKNVVAEYFQMSLHLLANGLNYTGIRVRYLIPLLALPMTLIFFAFKQKKTSILVLGLGMSLVQLLFSTILAIKSGHTISFVPKYAVFNQPYMFLVFALGILYIFEKVSKQILMKGIIGVIVLINLISIYPVYLDNIVFVATESIREENGYVLSTNKIKTYPQNTKIIVPSLMHVLLHSFYLKDCNYQLMIDNTSEDVIAINSQGEKEIIFKNINRENY